MQYNQDGTYKRAVESDRAHYCVFNPRQRSQRPQGPGSTRGYERNPMDLANRRPLERSNATAVLKYYFVYFEIGSST